MHSKIALFLYHCRIQHIWIRLGFVSVILIDSIDFLDQIYPKRYFRSKTEKVNITIKFCIYLNYSRIQISS